MEKLKLSYKELKSSRVISESSLVSSTEELEYMSPVSFESRTSGEKEKES